MRAIKNTVRITSLIPTFTKFQQSENISDKLAGC